MYKIVNSDKIILGDRCMVKIIKGLILGLIVACLVCGCSSSGIKEISFDEFKDKINNKDTFILYIGNKNCHNCTSYEPVLKKVLNDYNITVYKLDNSKLSYDEFKEFSKYFSIQGTPTILFVNNGEEETTINRIVGNTSEKSTIERFKTNGYIK